MSPGLIELEGFRLVGLVSRWAHLNPPGSASTPLMERGSRRNSLGSGESVLSGLSGLSFMTVPPLLCAELLRGLGFLRSVIDGRFGWRRWNVGTASMAFSRFSAGSHVLSSGPYPFHHTKYCNLFLCILESSMSSTSYSTSPFTISGGDTACCFLPSILFAR